MARPAVADNDTMRRLLLVPVAILGLAASNALAASGHGATTFNGRISGLNSATITARDGSRSATCFLTIASPAVTSFELGDHVQLACRDRVLVAIALKSTVPPLQTVTTPSTPTTTTTASTSRPGQSTTTRATTTTTATTSTSASGTITALTPTSVTVTGNSTLTCSIGPSSPNPASYGLGVGSKLGIACANGILTHISTATA